MGPIHQEDRKSTLKCREDRSRAALLRSDARMGTIPAHAGAVCAACSFEEAQ
jgi:hypothetical protein